MLNKLRLQNFRSYKDQTFEFNRSINTIVGPNASGKTNLLEAVLVVCRGNSYRAKDNELISFNRPWTRLDAELANSHRTVKIVAEPRPEKSLEVDKKLYKRIGLEQTLPVVLFEVEAFAVPLTVVVFTAVAFAAALTVMVFATMVLAVIGSAIETSMTGSSSLAILGTRSFTIRTHTTGTIPTAIILTVTDTIRTINQVTKAVPHTATLWLDKSSSVWLGQATIMALSMA